MHAPVSYLSHTRGWPRPSPLQVSNMIFEQPLSDYYVAKMLDYSPKVEFFMQLLNDLKILVDNSTIL